MWKQEKQNRLDCHWAEWGQLPIQNEKLLELLETPLGDMTEKQRIDYFRWYGMMKWFQWETLENFVKIAIIPNEKRTKKQRKEWSIFTVMIDYGFSLEDAQMYIKLEAIPEQKRTKKQQANYERLVHMIDMILSADESIL